MDKRKEKKEEEEEEEEVCKIIMGGKAQTRGGEGGLAFSLPSETGQRDTPAK